MTKIIEKPNIKNKECTAVILLISDDGPNAFMSSKDFPVIYVIYEGKRGKTQGERNVRAPAKKDTTIETSLPLVMFSP